MKVEDIIRKASEAGVRLVTFAYCDNSGIIRGKATHISGLERRLQSGIGVTTAMQAMGDMDRLQVVDGTGPVGEFRMVPDLDRPKKGAILEAIIAPTTNDRWRTNR